MNDELLYKLSLTLIPNIGPVQAKILLQHYDPAEIFRAKRAHLEKMEGIGTIRANNIKDFDDLRQQKRKFHLLKSKISSRFSFQTRVIQNAPVMLYYKEYQKLMFYFKC
jgi:DNA processing protein